MTLFPDTFAVISVACRLSVLLPWQWGLIYCPLNAAVSVATDHSTMSFPAREIDTFFVWLFEWVSCGERFLSISTTQPMRTPINARFGSFPTSIVLHQTGAESVWPVELSVWMLLLLGIIVLISCSVRCISFLPLPCASRWEKYVHSTTIGYF